MGTIIDGKEIRVDIDIGFEEGRQYGRGKYGCQRRDEMRKSYDPDRPWKKNYYNNIRGRSFLLRRRLKTKVANAIKYSNENASAGSQSFRIPLNSQYKNFKVIESQILK